MSKVHSEKLSGQYRAIIRRRRIVFLIVVVGVVLLRIFSCKEDIAPDSAASRRPCDDYNRYNNQSFTCIKVIDGDTIDVNIPDPNARKARAYTRIRFWGIDTPELPRGGKKGMYFAYEATEFARKLLAGKRVRLELVEGKTRGYYGRLLAYIWLDDGRMFNELAVKEGYAYADYRFKHPRREEFIKLEKKSRDSLKGLWKKVTPSDLPHWYRKSKLKYFWKLRKLKNRRETRRSSACPTFSMAGLMAGRP